MDTTNYKPLPTGVTKTFYQTKSGKWTVTYRVRVKIGSKAFDKSFDNAGRAIGYLSWLKERFGES
jgi:hypothetical protein